MTKVAERQLSRAKNGGGKRGALETAATMTKSQGTAECPPYSCLGAAARFLRRGVPWFASQPDDR
jgi:hypothetical protein